MEHVVEVKVYGTLNLLEPFYLKYMEINFYYNLCLNIGTIILHAENSLKQNLKTRKKIAT